MSALISIGAAVLEVIGMNPQRVTSASEAGVAGRPTFGGMDYQLTGQRDSTVTIEAETAPLVFGGLDAYGWLDQHHRDQHVVPLIRLGANYLGRVDGLFTIRNLESEEDRIHPFTGVGRRFAVTVELLDVGGF